MGEQLVFGCGGELLSRAPRAGATGTVVHVNRLFARTPVRRRVAAEKARRRAEDTETQRVFVSYGLALPHLKLSLRSADASPPRVWNKPAVASLDAAVSSCLGARVLVNNQRIAGSGTVRDACGSAEEEEGKEVEVAVEASLPKAGCCVATVSRSRLSDLYLFLNNRCACPHTPPTPWAHRCSPSLCRQACAHAAPRACNPRRLLGLLPGVAVGAVARGRRAPALAPALRRRQSVPRQAAGGAHMRAGGRALCGGPAARGTAPGRRPRGAAVDGVAACLRLLLLPLAGALHGRLAAAG